MNVGSLLTANAARFPDRIALIEHERKVSYDQLNNRVNRLANKLLALNVRKGDKVSLYLGSSVAWAEIYFALSKIGAVVVPVNSRIKGNELVHIVKNSDSILLFVDSTLKDNVDSVKVDLQGTKHFVLLGDNPAHGYILYEELFDEGSQNEPDVSVSGEDVHSICYTSGTTGSPRGAVLTNLNIVIGHYFMCTAEFYVTHDDIFLATTPLSQRIGWGKLINSVALGCTLVILPSFNAEEAMKIVEREKVTIMSIIPTIGRLILQVPHIESYDSSSLKMLFVTGEAFPIEVKKGLTEKFPHVRLVSYFASTEGGVITNLMHETMFTKPRSVGHPIPGVEVKIVNDEGNELPAGEIGEITVRCGKPGMLSVMKEYYKEPEYTREAFVDEWFRTGDLGRFDNEGHLYIIDRKKDMIISGGFNIYSREVEMVLESHEKVAEVAVIGVPDEQYGEAVKAFIVLKKGARATGDELIEYCKANMTSYKKPKHIAFVTSLPRNAVGKVLKYRLKQDEGRERVPKQT